MEALPLRAGRANCMSNIQQDMIEQTLAILASMMQQAAHDATLYCADGVLGSPCVRVRLTYS